MLGIADTVGEAYFKAEEATKTALPLSGTVLITVNDKDKPEVVEVAKTFIQAGFRIMSTSGTAALLISHGLPVEEVCKIDEGRPDCYDVITNGRVQLVVNTPVGAGRGPDDSYIRKACIKSRVPYITTIAAALASAKGILAVQKGQSEVQSLQERHSHIK